MQKFYRIFYFRVCSTLRKRNPILEKRFCNWIKKKIQSPEAQNRMIIADCLQLLGEEKDDKMIVDDNGRWRECGSWNNG